MNDGERAGFPEPRLPFPHAVPRDVERRPIVIESHAEGPVGSVAVLLEKIGVEESQDFWSASLDVELDDRAAVARAAAMRAGDVIEIATRGIDLDRGDVLLRADGSAPELLDRL